jgi:hypothetical protein
MTGVVAELFPFQRSPARPERTKAERPDPAGRQTRAKGDLGRLWSAWSEAGECGCEPDLVARSPAAGRARLGVVPTGHGCTGRSTSVSGRRGVWRTRPA